MAEVVLKNVDKSYGEVPVLFDVSLSIDNGEFVVFVGPSGCGKTTLLRMIAGLETISAGSISIGGADVTNTAPSDRGVAMVFQSYALYPHMTVRGNMEFGLRINGVSKAEQDARVGRAAQILQLEAYLDRRPAQLSGGQRQRVAIGRAIVKEPGVFLFDEPLSNLDAALRIQMRVELESLHSALGSTMVYVTHDQVEAMTLADKIVVLDAGRVQQIGPPLELYHRPRTRFVAGFIGAPPMNFLHTVVAGADEGTLRLRYGADEVITVPGVAAAPGGDALTLGVRPEHVKLGAPEGAMLKARVHVVEALGNESFVHVDTATGDRMVVRSDGDARVGRGTTVGLTFDTGRCHVFAPDGLTLQRTGP